MKCIACKKTNFKLFRENSFLKLPVFECKNCGLYVTGDSLEALRRNAEVMFTNENSENVRERSIRSDYTDDVSIGKKRQWISQFAYCKKYFENRIKILEIGSGAGQSLFWFEQEGFYVTGIDPDKNSVELVNKRLKNVKCLVGFAENFDTDEKFQVVWISHVFEHLFEPKNVLENLKNVLTEDGILFIEVPNCENEIILKSSVLENPSTYHYTKKSLLELAKHTDYDVQACDYFRAPSRFEGLINLIFSKKLKIANIFPFYPKIKCGNKEGIDLRIILKKK